MRMNKFALLAAACLMMPLTTATGATGTPTVPIEVWALRDAIQSVDISPDGQHLALLRMPSKDGEYVLEIYKTSDLSKPWRRLDADKMEIITARFISDDYLFGNAWQVIDDKVDSPEDDVRGYRTWSYSLKSNKFSGQEGSFTLANVLPKEPNKVLIATATPNDGGFGVDPFAAFTPRSYYKYNLENGTKELVMRGNPEHPTGSSRAPRSWSITTACRVRGAGRSCPSVTTSTSTRTSTASSAGSTGWSASRPTIRRLGTGSTTRARTRPRSTSSTSRPASSAASSIRTPTRTSSASRPTRCTGPATTRSPPRSIRAPRWSGTGSIRAKSSFTTCSRSRSPTRTK